MFEHKIIFVLLAIISCGIGYCDYSIECSVEYVNVSCFFARFWLGRRVPLSRSLVFFLHIWDPSSSTGNLLPKQSIFLPFQLTPLETLQIVLPATLSGLNFVVIATCAVFINYKIKIGSFSKKMKSTHKKRLFVLSIQVSFVFLSLFNFQPNLGYKSAVFKFSRRSYLWIGAYYSDSRLPRQVCELKMLYSHWQSMKLKSR